ncbi:MAG TPA: RraA family protein [Chloroflexi bacterium]|nr:RraA family protein [Chloroflexota bacterium]
MDKLRLKAEDWSTAVIADACVQQGVKFGCAQPGSRAVTQGRKLAARVVPVRHFGSVEIFLRVLNEYESGGALVIDNDGRMEEGCVGDLIAHEVAAAGWAGIAIWGAHRDTNALQSVTIPLFSYGSCPIGPREVRADPGRIQEEIRFAGCPVGVGDWIFADDDGILFVPERELPRVLASAEIIARKEEEQLGRLFAGISLRTQLRFDEYMERKRHQPSYGFREHLREIGGAIEA